MVRRSSERWDSLSPSYRSRLERHGVSREDYIAGANLQGPRGQSSEREHSRQRYILGKYGPTDIHGEPIITPKDLRAIRSEHGDQWVTNRVDQMARDYKTSARGEPVYPGDTQYSTRADVNTWKAGTNPYAPFYWYHGEFG